ncbi:MAG: class I adenylate-forming enzyme family protein [Chloroflexota bacterium]
MIRDTTIDSVLRTQALKIPSKVAIQTGEIAATFGDISHRAEHFARWLISVGIQPQDRVAIWLPNGVPWVIAHIGVSLAGAVSVPVSTRLVEREVQFILQHSESKVVVAATRFLNRDYAAEARNLMLTHPEVNIVAIDPTIGDLPGGPANVTTSYSRSLEPAVVMYTSGTTGFPKGCVLSHRSWTNNARLSAEVAGVTPDDVILCPSPFFHLFGSLTGLMGALSMGCTCVTFPTFGPLKCIQAIQSFNVTRMVAVPTMWLDLMKHVGPPNLPTLRGGVWGGADFPRAALERAMDDATYAWDLQAIYGMTEAPTLTQIRPSDGREQKVGAVGRPTPEVEVRIVDPITGQEVESGQEGEIWGRGYNRMVGYLKDPIATEARFAGEWIRSGDLGTRDSYGFLRVTGRLTDMILVGGANVYAREVEDVLLAAKGVSLAAVVGQKDERLGEVPIAWVVPSGGAALDAPTLLKHCQCNLAGFKIPREIFVVQEVPLTGSGKIHKALLKQRANLKGN